MNRYSDELNGLSFTDAQKAAMIRRLTRETPVQKPRRLPLRAAVALAAAISLLVGVTAGASLTGLSPEFREIFGVTDESEAAELGAVIVDQTFEDKNGSGASVTVREMVADQARLYVLMDFTAPEGTVLRSPERSSSDRGYWLWGGDVPGSDFEVGFYTDESCTQRVFPGRGYGYGIDDLADSDPTDNVITLLLRVNTGSDFGDARYFRCTGIRQLATWQEGVGAVPAVDDIDISFTLPLPQPTVSYSFTGRSGVRLGGTTMAVVENLTVSPISITMDLIIPESSMDAYNNTENKEDSWPVYVLIDDGTTVAASFGGLAVSTDTFRTDDGVPFFWSRRVIFALEHPIDMGRIKDIVFVGDNDSESKAANGSFHFFFSPQNFRNDDYWDGVNRVWSDEAE